MTSDRPNLAGSLSPTKTLHSQGRKGSQPNAYETSLISEYARFALLLIAVPLLIAYLQTYANHQVGLLAIIANLCLIGSLLFTFGNSFLRLIVLGCLALNLIATMINVVKISGVVDSSINSTINRVLLSCLIVACIFEATAALKSVSRSTLYKMVAWGCLSIPVLIYVVAIPSLSAFLQLGENDPQKLALRDPEWNLSNEITFRAAKFLVFAAFAYLGACLGSFLNVVAASIPNGQAIAWRNSQCVKCNAPISRFDNLPIFSYINLGGKCRNCRSPIPLRYLLVEFAAAFIFGSLFLYELVSGGDNVPGLSCRHEGILWIILYPKWPVIAIYFLHAFFMCFLLVLALMESAKQPVNRKFLIMANLAFFIPMMLYLPTQPVPLFENAPPLVLSLAPWLEQLIKLSVGIVLGGLIGAALNKLMLRQPLPFFTAAFLITGMVLGWQALVQVTLLFGLIYGLLGLFSGTRSFLTRNPTMVLFGIILIHHPFWKLLVSTWNFSNG